MPSCGFTTFPHFVTPYTTIPHSTPNSTPRWFDFGPSHHRDVGEPWGWRNGWKRVYLNGEVETVKAPRTATVAQVRREGPDVLNPE